ASRQDGRVSVDERCRQRPHYPTGGRQGRRPREDAEGDFQMKVLPLLVGVFLLQSGLQPPSPADFGQWERLGTSPDHGGLSPDGRWLPYGINRTNGENELRVTSIADGATKTIAFGAQQAFSSDSKWLAASVGASETEQEKLRKARKPFHRKLALLNLSTADLTTIDGIESFAFSADGHQLLMRRYAPEPSPPRQG